MHRSVVNFAEKCDEVSAANVAEVHSRSISKVPWIRHASHVNKLPKYATAFKISAWDSWIVGGVAVRTFSVSTCTGVALQRAGDARSVFIFCSNRRVCDLSLYVFAGSASEEAQ